MKELDKLNSEIKEFEIALSKKNQELEYLKLKLGIRPQWNNPFITESAAALLWRW